MPKPQEVVMERVGVVGLGYVGLPLLAALANVGYQVMGLDINARKVEALRETLEADIYEPGVTDVLRRYRHHIEFTSSYSHLMACCDVVMVTVGTPLRRGCRPNLDHVNQVGLALGRHLRPGQTVILKSTLPPGQTRCLARVMEAMSGLKAGTDFYVAFCPERIAEGVALHEFCSLPKVVGGINSESTERAASIIARLGGKVMKVSCPEVAELAKLIDNCYRTINIAFANEIALVCEKLHIDVHEVRSACNDGYERTKLFQAGLGAGGSCLHKDPRVFAYYAQRQGIQVELVEASLRADREATLRPAAVVAQFLRDAGLQRPKLSLLGLAFKGFPETDDLRDSPSLSIYEELGRQFRSAEFSFYDPLIREFQGRPVCLSLRECVRDSHVVMFLTNHRALLNVDVQELLLPTARPLLIVDCWHNVRNLAQAKRDGVQVFRIGDGTL